MKPDLDADLDAVALVNGIDRAANIPALLHRIALLLAAESERALTAEERLEQMTRERDKLERSLEKTYEYIEQLRKVTEPEMQRHPWTILQTATQAFSAMRGLLGDDQRWALDFPNHVQLELEELKEIKAERDEARAQLAAAPEAAP